MNNRYNTTYSNIMYNIMYMIWLKQNKMHKIEMIKTL